MKKVPYKTDQNNPTIRAYKEAVEKGKRDQHILPFNGGWVVKSLLSEKVSKIFSTQNEAADYAKSISKAHGTAVFIHGADGRIQERQDYSGHT